MRFLDWKFSLMSLVLHRMLVPVSNGNLRPYLYHDLSLSGLHHVPRYVLVFMYPRLFICLSSCQSVYWSVCLSVILSSTVSPVCMSVCLSLCCLCLSLCCLACLPAPIFLSVTDLQSLLPDLSFAILPTCVCLLSCLSSLCLADMSILASSGWRVEPIPKTPKKLRLLYLFFLYVQ